MLAKEMKMQFVRLLVTWPMVSLPASQLFPPNTQHPHHNGLPLVCEDIVLSLNLGSLYVLFQLPGHALLSLPCPKPAIFPVSQASSCQGSASLSPLPGKPSPIPTPCSRTLPMRTQSTHQNFFQCIYFITLSVSYLCEWMPHLFWSLLSNIAPSLKCWD